MLPIPRLLPMENYLDYLANRVLPDPSVRRVLEGLWSASAVPGTDAMVERLATALASLGLPDELNAIAARRARELRQLRHRFPRRARPTSQRRRS